MLGKRGVKSKKKKRLRESLTEIFESIGWGRGNIAPPLPLPHLVVLILSDENISMNISRSYTHFTLCEMKNLLENVILEIILLQQGCCLDSFQKKAFLPDTL